MPGSDDTTKYALEFVEKVFNEHDVGYLRDSLREDFVDHSPPPGAAGDKASTVAFLEQMFANMPDMRAEVIRTVASGNKVAVHARYSGTDSGGFMPGMPPTGKRITMDGIDISEIDDDGKHASHYGIQDTMAAMMQLGLMTPRVGPTRPEP
jgi:predicted ester cyclase